MKNLLKIITVVLVVFAGTQGIKAQELKKDADRPEVIAKTQVNEIDAKLDLNGDQERALFRAIVSKIVNDRKLVDGKDANDPTVKTNKAKIEDGYKAAVKKALGEEKYKAWLKLQ
ncbi:hypothetical protein ACFQO1_02675 [Jejudonia soesokkakensis]|uniref:Peptidylprolyl isomerase n=1 Tax=Jejudonia soesokkakensis TaxID=1323432 RepID=A0ABW2MS91_9FLAO